MDHLFLPSFDTAFVTQFSIVLAALLVAIVVTFGPARLADAFDDGFRRVEVGVTWISRSGWRAVSAIMAIEIVLRVTLLPLVGVPLPFVHDEYSSILQAQMMVQGRLAWPTPELWEAFETFHVNMIPNYASIYFPGRGAPMALGLLLTGQPWPGVLIVMALLAGATVWALRGWMGPRLAFGGGLLVVLSYGTASYWINSYWGGAFTALGGALLLGAYPRLMRAPQWRDGLMMGVGLLVLTISRPFEGFFLALPVAAACLFWFVRRLRQGHFTKAARLAVPAAVFLGLAGLIMISANLAATGEAGQTAYGINRDTYALAPALLSAPPLDGPKRGDARFRAFYEWEASSYAWRDSLASHLRSIVNKTEVIWSFYVTALFTIPFMFGIWRMVRRRRFAMPLLSGIAVTLAFYNESWDFSHYVSPAFIVAILAIMLGFEAMVQAGPLFRRMAWTLAVAALPALLVPLGHGLLVPPQPQAQTATPCCQFVVRSYRADLLERLQGMPGRHLVLVSYAPGATPHDELVWNEPDIDAATIIWARDLGPEMNKKLLARYPDRTVWHVTGHLRNADGGVVLTRSDYP
ncbi:hypothetical protein [Falsirhodobacter deserti]|uniref:hypothetical protein n=1 Tax=Falsirhodobacter deserti TaxID=1365611 RepID=UPI000FE2FFB2|nr:hypothetical protein [Falsirhodobacter deserti]